MGYTDAEKVKPPKSWWRWPRRLAVALFMALALLVAAALLLDTSIGRRFLTEQLSSYEFANGLRIEIDEINGSVYGKSTLKGVRAYDPEGLFFETPGAQLDWKPLAWVGNKLDIRELIIDRGRLVKRPKFTVLDEDSPLLPGFDISIAKLHAEDLVIEEQVAGRRQIADVDISAEVASGIVRMNVLAGVEGGDDRILVHLDAVPDANKLSLNADVNAPKGGVIGAIAGLDASFRGRITGDGDWQQWEGAIRIDSGPAMLTAAKLYLRDGEGQLIGQAYPRSFVSGVTQQLLGEVVSFNGTGTIEGRVLDGTMRIQSPALVARAVGAVDLGENIFDAMQVDGRLRGENLLGEGIALRGTRFDAVLDGPFSDLDADYTARADGLEASGFVLTEPIISGTANWNGTRALIPVELRSAGVGNDNELVERTLRGLAAQGDIIWRNGRFLSDNIAVTAEGMKADLKLRGMERRGAYALSGNALFPALAIENVGAANVNSQLRLVFGGGNPWRLSGNATALMQWIENKTLVSIAGENIRIATNFNIGQGLPLLLDQLRLSASKLRATGSGRRLADGNIELVAKGTHEQYGPFALNFAGKPDTANAELLLDDPLPSLGLKQVRLALAPIADGFEINAKGGSTLGPFSGLAQIFAQPQGKTLIRIDNLLVSKTRLRGDLIADGMALSGNLAASGGGINGNLAISPQGAGQRITADLTARNARFEGDTPITVSQGKLDATAFLVTGRSDIDATLNAQGLRRGNLFIGKVDAAAKLTNGAGRVTANIAGRRGSRFELRTAANIAPNTVRFTANGKYGRRKISMPRNGVLRRLKNGGWNLAQTRINVGQGATVLSGRFGGGVTDMDFQMSKMPLALADLGVAELGLGGTASGIIEYRQENGAAPTGTAKLQIKQLTRSGLVLTSRPVDVAVNAALGANAMSLRGVLRDKDNSLGRFQARISALPVSGSLVQRLERGRLFGQVRYAGPADALWRLVKVEVFDLTGKVDLAADVTGSLENPQIRGSLATGNARLESALSGTVVENIKARGRFSGSVLTLTGFTGSAPGGGTVTGSGTVDLGTEQGVGVNLTLRANRAQLLNRDDIAATVTGPITVRSSGNGGVLGGNVTINKGRFRLGNSEIENKLPNIAYREVNRRADELPPRVASSPWRYDITAKARNRLDVTGLGLESEWGADIRLKGTVDAPRISGRADLVRGDYIFAGRSFELERGRISFRSNSPPDPRLDIVAIADVQGLDATINVNGTGLRPEITFNSVPAMPEEELLARLLFGTSINDISAAEAVQLAAAVASLRTGGGLDPINQLRTAVGLDRLRIIGADAATGQKTSIAAGKYITRRAYVEVVTDGRGYSATQVEFQITRWLSILSSISTLGRESVNVRISKDY
ncbi:translocation/assembly module TamB domain-containing protein [Sphingorhabdus sp. Alg239-R122]|uniref:translocation/assembly module TamB domain-containing protein n=1 Tax=Sphingorhabdus sp. Alg239-R122 TaxID=2305989 RepID=UPI0013D8E365|nr:translocation/assembly module TamB domain-containing protein [Sphingorhabdus sp. Alg239-R122]